MTLKRYRNSELGERVVTRERLRLIIVSTGCARHPLYHGPSHLISAASHLVPSFRVPDPRIRYPGSAVLGAFLGSTQQSTTGFELFQVN